MIDGTVEVGPFRLNLRQRKLTREGKTIVLAARAMDVLCALAAMDGEPITKDELLARVWPGVVADENNLHVHISALRRLLGEAHKAQLVTIPGYGYRLLTSQPSNAPTGASPSKSIPGKSTLAVLAFRNRSGAVGDIAFTDGLTDDVMTQLARTRSLWLVGHPFGQSGSTDAQHIGQRFGVRYVLEGSVRHNSAKIRVNARLIDAATGAHLWAESYNRIFGDPYEVSAELANAVAAATEIVITSFDQRSILRKPTDNLDAWETFERGLWHFAQCGIEQNERARDFLRHSMTLDPELSKAYQWLVYVHVQDGIHYRTRPIEEARAAATELAMRAIELDPNDAGSYAAAGFAAQMSNDLAAGLANAECALSLNPNDGDALRLKGACLLGMGMGADGAETLRMSVRLRPGDPLNWRAPHHLCWYSYVIGDWAAAVAAGRSALRLNANQCLTHAWLAAGLAQLGQVAEAQQVMARSAQLIAPVSFSEHVQRRLPWISEDDHARMLEGLRKAGWRA